MARTEQLWLALTPAEVTTARSTIGREPTDTEWAILDAQWSEHCGYKSSNEVLKQLPVRGRRVVVGPGFDAGAVDVGGGYVVTIHIESHNHPSAVDPHGGAATGVGGVLRDILAMGTKPIALLDSLRFGRPERSGHSRWVFKNVVRGIADYGNCVGVPTVGGEVEFDESFERNCLVDVACIGLGLAKKLVLARASYPGDLLVLAGGSTGRDGLGGAAFASKTLTGNLDAERSAVQVPDPFMKKLLHDATLEVVETGVVRGLKDLGGGGLATALSEVAEKGGTGVDVELSRVIAREPGLTPTELIISESQERMLFILENGKEAPVFGIFRKYGVPYSVIGTVTAEGYLTVRCDGEIVAQLPARFVAKSPGIQRGASKPRYIDALARIEAPARPHDIGATILSLLSSPNIASKEWVYSQYDHEVGVRTVVKPGHADAAVLGLPNGRFLAVKADGNSNHSYLDPYHGAAGCVSEACRNIAAVGAEPIAMVDHLQFGHPGNPEVYWTFVEAVRGLADYCRVLELPVVGGKVSFYNEDATSGRAIKPSPVVAVVGIIQRPEQICTMAFKERGNFVLVVGETRSEMGGSEYYEYVHRLTGGTVPKTNALKDKNVLDAVLHLIRKGGAKAVHDCSKGGLAVALAEMCIAGRIGVSANLSKVPGEPMNADQLLFSESHGRFLVEVAPAEIAQTTRFLSERGVPHGVLGEIGGSSYRISRKSRDVAEFEVRIANDAWSKALPACLGEQQ